MRTTSLSTGYAEKPCCSYINRATLAGASGGFVSGSRAFLFRFVVLVDFPVLKHILLSFVPNFQCYKRSWQSSTFERMHSLHCSSSHAFCLARSAWLVYTARRLHFLREVFHSISLTIVSQVWCLRRSVAIAHSRWRSGSI